MQKLIQFFSCCTKQIKQDELSITMTRRSRTKANSSQPRKTFIKRSIGKNPILDLSFKTHRESTMITLGGGSMNRTQNLDKDRSINTQRQMSVSLDNNNKNLLKNISQFQINSQKKHQQSINNGNDQSSQNRFEEKDKEPFIYENIQIKQVANTKQNQQTNSFLARKNKICQNFIKKNNDPPTRKPPNFLNYNKIIGLDTIQQRQSIPSMSSYHDYRHISSKITLKLSHDHQKQNQLNSNNTSQICKSLMFPIHQSFSHIQKINSQNLQKNNQETKAELQKIMINKLQTDIKLLQRQLQSLKNQQNMLINQKKYIKNKENKQLGMFQRLQRQISSKIDNYQRQILEIKNLMGLKMTNGS